METGFSLWELVVTMLVFGVVAGIAVPVLSTSRRGARVQETASLVAAEMRMRAGQAMRGTDVAFSVGRGTAIPPSIVFNPGWIAPPDSTVSATDVVFEGGTGDARVGGRLATVAIVVADSGDTTVGFAVVAGRKGVVRIKRLEVDGWRDWQ